MTRRVRRGRSSGPKNNIWSVVQMEDVSISTTPVDVVIMAPGEWQPAGSGFEHATLLRIRGWLSASKGTAVGVGSLQMAIYVVDEDALTIGALTTALYAEEDVIWTGGVQFGASSASVEAPPSVPFNIDIKSMRKISSATDIRLTLESSVTGLCFVSGLMRALIRKGGN